MKFYFEFDENIIHRATEKNNYDAVEFLLKQPKLDVNALMHVNKNII